MRIELISYNKLDIRLGDVYSYVNNDGYTLCEIVEYEKGLKINPLKFSSWKPVYEDISNDYLSDFDAILVYRVNS